MACSSGGPPHAGVSRRSVFGLGFGAVGWMMARGAHAASTVNVRRQYADGRFGQMHYRIARPEGEDLRTPLMCFHSSPNSGRIFETFLRHMGTDRTAIAVDTPGFGESDPPDGPPEIADYAAAMGDLADELGYRSIDVMGYHTGSKISVELARQRPDLVRRLVLVSAAIYTDEELSNQRTHFAREELTADGSHLADKWQEHVYWAMPGWTLDHVARQFPDAMRRPEISWWGHRAAFNYNLAKNLPEIGQSILVLNPDDDLHNQTARADGIMQNGTVKGLPGWGHGFLDIHSEEAATIVRTFLDEAN